MPGVSLLNMCGRCPLCGQNSSLPLRRCSRCEAAHMEGGRKEQGPIAKVVRENLEDGAANTLSA
jgi:hypothetical protein